VTGVDTDLATLLPSECPNCGRLHAGYDFNANPGPVQAELSRLREEWDALSVRCEFPLCVLGPKPEWCGKCGDTLRAEAAEARLGEARQECARLQQALAGLESAVRILDVMLREPAAEGLMSPEDYRSYVQGAWLGVDEAAKKVREALAGPDTPTTELAPEAVRALVRLREMLYDATITYSSFCGRCGPMDDADPADPKYLGSPMMTETLPLREVVEKALAGPGSEQSSLTESGSAGLPDTPADSLPKFIGRLPHVPADSQEDKT
jgi:ribosomal protein S27AE